MADRLLIVEDDAAIGAALRDAVTAARFDVTWCHDGASALSATTDTSFSLVLLDLGLPDLDGSDLCRTLRMRMSSAVIVILTARDGEIDVVVGLEAGADDYLIKPVRTTELIARIRAHLRRRNPPPSSSVTTHTVGDLLVDVESRRVLLAGHEVAMRPKQFELLVRLAEQPDKALSRSALMSDVWDEHWFGSTKTLDVHIAGLRQLLADAARQRGVCEPRITTLRGFGYRLESA